MTDPAALTDEELAAMERHFAQHRPDALFGNPIRKHCRACSFVWPCPTSRLLAALRASRADADHLRKYAKHTHKCRMQPWFDEQWCTCGLDPERAAPTLT